MKYLILNEQMDTFCYETMRLLSHEKVLVQAESCSRGYVFDKVAEVGVTCIVISKTGLVFVQLLKQETSYRSAEILGYEVYPLLM